MKALQRCSTLALSGLLLLMSVRQLHAQPPAPTSTTDALVLMTLEAGVPREVGALRFRKQARAAGIAQATQKGAAA